LEYVPDMFVQKTKAATPTIGNGHSVLILNYSTYELTNCK